MGPCRLMPTGSNYTFITSVALEGRECPAIYKPKEGEAPLWDFPQGTLYKREYAAYLLSQGLRWNLVPQTVIRDGAYGVGAVQLFVTQEQGANYFTLREEYASQVQNIALFDLVANNADRKAGHCIKGADGRIWSIDHGLTFHALPKLRTVIWDFAGQAIPQELLKDLKALAQPSELMARLSEVLEPQEITALEARAQGLLASPSFPSPRSYHDLPWPWI